jgi:hypothetical protein
MLVSGCGAGTHPAVLDDAPLDTQSAVVDDIHVSGAIVVSPQTDTGAPADRGTLVVTIVNTGDEPDAFIGATFGTTEDIDPPARAKATLAPAKIDLPPNTPVVIPSDAGGSASLDGGFAVGTYVNAELDFEVAGSVRMTLLVVAPDGIYAQYK